MQDTESYRWLAPLFLQQTQTVTGPFQVHVTEWQLSQGRGEDAELNSTSVTSRLFQWSYARGQRCKETPGQRKVKDVSPVKLQPGNHQC